MNITSQAITKHNSIYYNYKIVVTFESFNEFFTVKINDLSEKTEAIKKLYNLAVKCKNEQTEIDLIKFYRSQYIDSLKSKTFIELSEIERDARNNMFNDNLSEAEQIEYSGIYQAVNFLKSTQK